LPLNADDQVLTAEQRKKATDRLERREGIVIDATDDFSLLQGLDLGEKYSVIMRLKSHLDHAALNYYSSQIGVFEKAIPVRNAVMHGRPLTTIEFALGFSLANDFLKHQLYWPYLNRIYRQYNDDPEIFIGKAVSLLDEDLFSETLNNLPVPDYDDTGFLPRPKLEWELRKKILGRHPVVTVLGEGGNGKTALTIQTLYGLIASNDHPFDAIVWISAKSARLGTSEIERVEGAINDSLGLLTEVARQFEPGEDSPQIRVRRLLE
jgi:LuxR family glucitol operon transcriptional activator